MSQKRKRGLQSGLSEIVARQTAPAADKSELSRGLIDRFTEPKATSPTTLPSHTRQTSHTRQGKQNKAVESVAPQRDFARVANSITREAVPAGFFKGKSKQLYDCLYALTRGAITPGRSVRISRPKLMKQAGIGARVTFDANVTHLQSVGLLSVRQIAGEHEGNEYTVFLPEETSMPSQTSPTRQAQKLVRLDRLESSQTRHSLSVDTQAISTQPKTSFKTTDRSDDEPLAGLIAKFEQASRELTGKEPSVAEYAKWGELAELLIAELQIAAARTGSVSSVPAFLTEHLRRRLWQKDKAQLERESREVASKSAPKVDVSKCPDCGGSGWAYEGEHFTGPVKKCRHPKLKS